MFKCILSVLHYASCNKSVCLRLHTGTVIDLNYNELKYNILKNIGLSPTTLCKHGYKGVQKGA